MIQFRIGGQYLDLPSDLELQFTKKNILFAFDDIECERTTSFEIPDTPNNNAILKLSKDYHNDGQGMRRKFEAQMQSGFVSKNGLLYVDMYDAESKSYSAIFVTGELVPLLKVKEVEDMSKFLSSSDLPDNVIYTGQAATAPADFAAYRYSYVDEQSPLYPSIRLDKVVRAALDRLGVPNYIPSMEYYITPKKLYNQAGTEAAVGDHVFAYNNLPEESLIDLIKTLAYVSGNVLYFDEYGRFTTNDLSARWDTVELHDVIKVASVSRTLENYARNNYIMSEEGKINILNQLQYSSNSIYYIDNDNIDAENELYVFPFDGGGNDNEAAFNSQSDKFGLASHRTGDAVALLSIGGLDRRMKYNTFIKGIFDKSTKVELSARMTMLEYENLKPRLQIWYDGAMWVWSDAEWSNGVITLKLLKVA